MIKTQLEEDSEIQKVLKNNLKSNNKKGGSSSNDNNDTNKNTKLVNLNLNDNIKSEEKGCC